MILNARTNLLEVWTHHLFGGSKDVTHARGISWTSERVFPLKSLNLPKIPTANWFSIVDSTEQQVKLKHV